MISRPYYYVRFRWLHELDLEELSNELEKNFQVETLDIPDSDTDLTLYKSHRAGLKVTADSLMVYLSRTRAILAQREARPFTEKDLELRKKILELYPKDRITPLPLFFSNEPEFEVEGKDSKN